MNLAEGRVAISFEEYVRHDGLGIADLVRRGEISALEAVDAAIARAEIVEPSINAIACELFDEARATASQDPQGPFGGVPFAIKDLGHPVRGAPATNGSRAFVGSVSDDDGESVRRFRVAGLVPISLSTTPEFGLTVTTESTLFGDTRNPWNLEHSTGGSSGGSAALVAAGVMPLAHATDGGGSIRVPASCCGLFGLKPSRGRTPVGEGRTESWNGLTASFAVTRSVRDAAHLLDLIHGPEAGSRYVAPPPAGLFAASIQRDPPPLRIAVIRSAPNGAEVDRECLRALDGACQLLTELGHEPEEATLPVDGPALAGAMARIAGAHTAAMLEARALERGRPIADDEIEVVTRALAKLGRSASALDLIAADNLFMATATSMARFQERFPVVLTPTLAKPPARIGELALSLDPRVQGKAFGEYCPFTALANQTGQPAMNVPLHWSKTGLPIGTHFIGRIGGEELLLQLAAQLERAAPWFDRRPLL